MARRDDAIGRDRLVKGRIGALARFLVALILGGGVSFLLFWLGKRFSVIAIPIPILVLTQGFAAALFSRLFALEWWWSAIQLLLPIFVFGISAFPLPGWIFPLIIVVWVLVFWNSVFGRVPLFLTNATTAKALAQYIAPYRDARVLDAGHGFAGVLLALSKHRPDVHFVGCETAPFPFIVSWVRLHMIFRRPNVELRYRNFWDVNFRDFDVVYAFLSPTPMRALHEKANEEMRPGSILISNSFAVEGVTPDETFCVDDRRKTRLLIWRM
ncbi:class I SAM-dependent methyltransferase [Varunaivibrio sulfuroxidans]|uniref:Trans-aconitate methyltransferase n=1 Tax=Varunaivibrio sulfuroxidans TaxID=1773489 RepID=A0A4R3JEL4_9PROT|nr:class I SAM-dependent methyltransferase [Varunaivibrio sulfuroxidans]TCS64244.1 hypothetical protein EDD55_102286 [Varunaivibrio sulfuroxidans]WES31315.1 hypothetical protein P3M64_02785 [Varunaivibrio sulfuroxidans]